MVAQCYEHPVAQGDKLAQHEAMWKPRKYTTVFSKIEFCWCVEWNQECKITFLYQTFSNQFIYFVWTKISLISQNVLASEAPQGQKCYNYNLHSPLLLGISLILECWWSYSFGKGRYFQFCYFSQLNSDFLTSLANQYLPYQVFLENILWRFSKGYAFSIKCS